MASFEESGGICPLDAYDFPPDSMAAMAHALLHLNEFVLSDTFPLLMSLIEDDRAAGDERPFTESELVLLHEAVDNGLLISVIDNNLLEAVPRFVLTSEGEAVMELIRLLTDWGGKVPPGRLETSF